MILFLIMLLYLIHSVSAHCPQGELYAGSLFINRILGWDLYLSTVLILLITAVYTIGGTVTLGECSHTHRLICYVVL